jgi:hypothetical protein
VIQRTLRESRASISEDIALKVVLCDLTDRSDPLLPVVLNAVEAFFQFSPPPLFGELGNGLRARFGGLLDSSPGEPEFVPPDLASLEDRHLSHQA